MECIRCHKRFTTYEYIEDVPLMVVKKDKRREALKHSCCQKLYITHIDEKIDCDTFFPEFEGQFELKSITEPKTEGTYSFTFAVYQRKNTN